MMINYRREGSSLHIKSYAFAVRITKMFLHFSENDGKLMVIYKQVLRSGTSVSANVHESEFAQSSSDFISKLHIALKEANETMNWLNLSFLGILASALCFAAWSRACDLLGTVRATVGIYAIPVVTFVFAYACLGERLSAVGAIGAVCTLAGVVISSHTRHE